eukprot:TRINITY_DN66422_c0_g1_i1.p1 TRINITY_DN66422_c0_g1~~TRINITY_DN66422_c0_g1_i1.p1  ORF type:complete len:428 (-),score=61.98 TRINITY_DN66422_c0_g1_i1:77-1360(-)
MPTTSREAVNKKALLAGVAERSEDYVRVQSSQLGWRPGCLSRLVHLEDSDDTCLRSLSGTLGRLETPVASTSNDNDQKWIVNVQGKRLLIDAENLRVCVESDECGLFTPGVLGITARAMLIAGLVSAGIVLVVAEAAAWYVANLAGDADGENAIPDLGRLGILIASIGVVAPALSLMWLVGTVAGCYILHEPLRDPACLCPAISELGVGPASARMLYRIGFFTVAMLMGSLLQLYSGLVLPHLPGGAHGEFGAAFASRMLWACVGVGAQGVFVLEPDLTLQTAAHLLGAALFFGGGIAHSQAAERLYRPLMSLPAQDEPSWSVEAAHFAEEAQAAIDASPLFEHSLLHVLVAFRHEVLMRGPWALFLLPLGLQFFGRAGFGAGTSLARAFAGLGQWATVAFFALTYASYGPELVVAAMLGSKCTVSA